MKFDQCDSTIIHWWLRQVTNVPIMNIYKYTLASVSKEKKVSKREMKSVGDQQLGDRMQFQSRLS